MTYKDIYNLTIHKFKTEEQYQKALDTGSIADTDLCLTPEKEILPAGTELGLVQTGGDVTIDNGIISINDNSHNHTIDNIAELDSIITTEKNNREQADSELQSALTLMENTVGNISVEFYGGLTDSQKDTLSKITPGAEGNKVQVSKFAIYAYNKINIDLSSYITETIWNIYHKYLKNNTGVSQYHAMTVFLSQIKEDKTIDIFSNPEVGDLMCMIRTKDGDMDSSKAYRSFLYQGDDQWLFCNYHSGQSPEYVTELISTDDIIAQGNGDTSYWVVCYVLRPELILRKLYGLGSELAIPLSNCDYGISTGWFQVKVPITNFTSKTGILHVESQNANNKTQTLYFNNGSNNIVTTKRYMCNGIWGDWKWITPLLASGSFYQTNEYYLNKPVYILNFPLGSLPAADSMKDSSLNITGINAIFRYEIISTTSDGKYVDVSKYISNVEFYKSSEEPYYWHVKITPTKDLSKYSAYLVIWLI